MKLEEIRALIAGATAGPWRGRDAHLSFVESAHGIAVIGGDHAVYNGADDRFICAARTLMPLLVDLWQAEREYDALRGPRGQLRKPEVVYGAREKVRAALAALEEL